MITLIPPIEENIPLPSNAAEAMPRLTPTEELNMRANVVKLMSDLTGQPLSPTQSNIEEATALAQQMAKDPQLRPNFTNYPTKRSHIWPVWWPR